MKDGNHYQKAKFLEPEISVGEIHPNCTEYDVIKVYQSYSLANDAALELWEEEPGIPLYIQNLNQGEAILYRHRLPERILHRKMIHGKF